MENWEPSDYERLAIGDVAQVGNLRNGQIANLPHVFMSIFHPESSIPQISHQWRFTGMD